MNPYHYIVANEKKGYNSKIRDEKDLVGILVVNKNSNLNNIIDINGKNFLFASANAFAATLLPKYELSKKYNIHNEIIFCFSKLIKTPLIINDLATIDNAVESFNKIEYISAVRIVNTKNIVINEKIFLLKSFFIEINEEKLARVQILYELSDIYKVIKDNRNKTFFLVILEILLSTFVAYFIGYRLTKRLANLTLSAEEISKNIIDEVSILENTLYIMQDKIFQRNNDFQELIEKLEYASIQLKKERDFHAAVVQYSY